MAESGVIIDSSVFPIRMSRYGIDGFERGYSIIQTPAGNVEELPVSVLEVNWPARFRIPVGGGGYFRLFPIIFLIHAMKLIECQGLPFVVYCHPYEFNPYEWRSIPQHISLGRRLHQGIGRRAFEKKIQHLLSAGNFGTISQFMNAVRENQK